MTHDDEAIAALIRIRDGSAAADLETETLDFKEDRASTAETERLLAEAAICFANSAGGTVVLGVSDRQRGPAALTGTALDPARIRQRIYELSRPHLVVEVTSYPAHPSVLLVHVPQSADIHSDTQGRAFRRINRDCLPMDPSQQERLREERRGIDWSAQPAGIGIAAVVPEAMATARRMLLTLTDLRRSLAQLGDRDLLAALGGLAGDGGLNRGGAVMFAAPGAALPDLIVYQFRATPGGDPRSVERLPAPGIMAFARAMELIGARQSSTAIALPNGQRLEIEDFPSLAVREALSNAVCHRDYHLAGSIQIEHSPSVLLISSPGPLVAGVTPQNILTTPSRPRNGALTKIARSLGLAEETGRGVDRMYREMIRSGRPVPTIESDAHQVRVVLTGGAPNANIARFVADLPEDEREDTDTMLILMHLCARRNITAELAAPLLQRSAAEAEAVLRRLASDAVGLIERTRHSTGRSTGVYRLRGEPLRRLGTAVAYHRRGTDETDRKIVAHVRDYGRITNRTLQNFLDVGVYKARDIIADLAERGVLTRISVQQRGPHVAWGKGPNFPVGKPRRTRQEKTD